MARGRGKAGGKLVRAALKHLRRPKTRLARRPFRQPGNVNGNWRLGPKAIRHRRVARLTGDDYKPYGNQSPEDFLKTHWDDKADSWKYPEHEGFATRTTPSGAVEADSRAVALTPGERIDRFGAENGQYMSPDGTPFEKRALPPSNLGQPPGDTAPHGYHRYEVVQPFAVDSGPIAPAFNQPGGGIQHVLRGKLIPGAPADVNVDWLVKNGFLRRLPLGVH